MTQSGIKLFNFQGSPVVLKWWFLLLFGFLDPIWVLAVFFSILLHEMGHAYMANKLGYRVSGIDIDIFSGSAKIESNMHERDSIKITVSGPIVNLILCLISLPFLYFDLNDRTNDLVNMIFTINGILFISNILPIYPTDGGRILRDILLIKNRRNAIKVSCVVTIIFSSLIAVIGIIFGHWIISIFAIFFGFLAIKELKQIR